MGVDREATVKKAEDLVREGKPELAIEEYLRLVDEQPGDVGAANALGDLYAKVGNRAAAVARFVQIGDTHRDSGFIPKAVAFYKKALKIDPACDHALAQLAQIAAGQELYADAALYVNRLLQRRREQNDEAGVADCLVRLGGFPTATADARLAAARAAANHMASADVARLWVEAADALERAGRQSEAVDALIQAANADGGDLALRRRAAAACADAGQIERAHPFLSFDTAGDHGGLLLALAQQALGDGRADDARRALLRVVDVAPEHRTEAEALLAPLQPAGEDGGSETATDAVEEPVAVEELVAAMPAADDWGIVTPTLVAERRVGESGWDALLDDGGSADETAFDTDETLGSDETLDIDVPAGAVSANLDTPVVTGTATELEWSSLLADGSGVSEPDAEPDFDAEPDTESPEPAAAPPPASAADASMISALTAAADNPALQFQASAQLGRLLLRLDRGREAVAWLERATQAPTAVREQRLDVMYELADALEGLGERARALDVFSDLEFDAASFRDVPERMARLRHALDEGRAP